MNTDIAFNIVIAVVCLFAGTAMGQMLTYDDAFEAGYNKRSQEYHQINAQIRALGLCDWMKTYEAHCNE